MVGERDSNMELMRVICMFMIVLCHSSFCVAWDEVPLSSIMLRFGANVGVYGFVLVSGYYMINSTISVTKLLRLWITVFSYSAGVYFILAMYGAIHVNLLDAFRYCTPFTSGRYWFVSTYFMLMLVSPLLNRGIKGLNKNVLILGIIIFTVYNGLTFSAYGSRLAEFCVLYAIAAYVRLYGEPGMGRSYLWWFAVAGGLLCLIELMCALGSPFDRIIWPGRGNPLMILMAASLFLGFSSLRIGCHTAVNRLAACTFGVYLLHCHPCLGDFIWNHLFHVKFMADSPWFIPYCLLVSLLVYCVCSLVELIRLLTVGRIFDIMLSRYAQYINALSNKLLALVSKIEGLIKRTNKAGERFSANCEK